MNLLKESPLLGIQAIPPFTREATLVQNVQCWNDWIGDLRFPAASSIFNIAALAFYPRMRMSSSAGGFGAATLGLSYWASSYTALVGNIFGQSKVVVPQGAEYFAVAWMVPPDFSFIGGPYPEDMFRIVWGLSL